MSQVGVPPSADLPGGAIAKFPEQAAVIPFPTVVTLKP